MTGSIEWRVRLDDGFDLDNAVHAILIIGDWLLLHIDEVVIRRVVKAYSGMSTHFLSGFPLAIPTGCGYF